MYMDIERETMQPEPNEKDAVEVEKSPIAQPETDDHAGNAGEISPVKHKESGEHSSNQEARSPFGYAKLCFPILLFPFLYFPYKEWWVRDFAMFASRIIRGGAANPFELLFTGNNMILLFWCLVTVVVMLASIVVSIVRVRPWYAIPVYLAVMFSLCGILSLFFYTTITS